MGGDIEEYVEKYMASYHVSREEAMSRKVVQDVIEYYEEQAKERETTCAN